MVIRVAYPLAQQCHSQNKSVRFSKRQDGRQFFQELGENICSLQPALKSTAPGL